MNAKSTVADLLAAGCAVLDRHEEERDAIAHEVAEAAHGWNAERDVLRAELVRAGEVTARLAKQRDELVKVVSDIIEAIAGEDGCDCFGSQQCMRHLDALSEASGRALDLLAEVRR